MDWIFLPVADSDGLHVEADHRMAPDLYDMGVQVPSPVGVADVFPNEVSGGFPGGLHLGPHDSIYPPPDAYAFYLPFHFFYPTWWGIYLLHEGVLQLAEIFSKLSGDKLSRWQYGEAARIFLLGTSSFIIRSSHSPRG
jgi:hypothetical protein